MHEDKDYIVQLFLKALQATGNQQDLKAARYEILDNNDEIVTLEWDNGYQKKVNVSADSGIALMRDILAALD
jgi:hypothetical protein